MPIEHELAEHRPYLMRYARLQLRNDAWAEDAVSETMLAALSKPQSFGNRSQLKTWLVGILKHKVIDLLRQRQREVCLDTDEGDGGDELDALMRSLLFRAPQRWPISSTTSTLVMRYCSINCAASTASVSR